MPTDLFHPVGVITCILVFKAHNIHPKGKKTFFGYFRDDGFVKAKHRGRIDEDNKWKSIKQEWLNLYLNRESKAGLSITQAVTVKDEWCAEAYIETDYSTLNKEDFEQTLKKYVAFDILNG